MSRVAEMIIFRASQLRGMARAGDDFQVGAGRSAPRPVATDAHRFRQEIGLVPEAVSAFLDSAKGLSLKVEEAIREVQEVGPLASKSAAADRTGCLTCLVPSTAGAAEPEGAAAVALGHTAARVERQ
jgi:hypothetical protein